MIFIDFPEFLECARHFGRVEESGPEFLDHYRISVGQVIPGNVYPEFLERALSVVTMKTQFPEFLEPARSFAMIQNTVSRISGMGMSFRYGRKNWSRISGPLQNFCTTSNTW
jgi:hypothetical protein